MAEEETDPEQRERIGGLIAKVRAALAGATPVEVNTVLAHVASRAALSTNDPEQAILHAVGAMGECYIGLRDRARSGKPEDVN
jgi:hypothetical protein